MEAAPTTELPEPRSRAAEIFLFASNFLRHPHMLGSFIPSSRFLVDTVLAPVDWSNARVIVEYGPGVGTFTAEILRRMRADARLVVIETNAEFVRFMRASLPDKRLIVEHDSAENVLEILHGHGLPLADYIVSGIPLGSFSRSLQASISEASRTALVSDGVFLVYQFTARVVPVLRETFPVVRCSRELRNLPPAQLFVCSHEGQI
jgi:phospholipid N-methyltransferase